MRQVVVLFCLYVVVLCDNRSRLVQLAQGPVRGYKDPDNDVYVFYGIPYAKAPTGTNRFKDPLPAPVWVDTFEAVDEEIVCPQSNFVNILTASKLIKEDCLIANVFVPTVDRTNLPVVIVVHGGAFVMGWGNMFTPKNLVESNKVIMVTFNYRLGAHGFLCLGTKDIPGNAGMKDQVALIRWVKMNIESFGGSPDDITLTGFSSGSASVETLILSKMTQGYIKKIIPESASALCPICFQFDPINSAKAYARLLNFDNADNITALEFFYKTLPYEVVNSGNTIKTIQSTAVMAPCIEQDKGQERFLEDSPVNILKSGKFQKIPILYGFTNTDGTFYLQRFDDWKYAMNTKFSDFLAADLQFSSEKHKQELSEKIKRFYFGDKLVGKDTVLDYVNYFTDIFFVYPIIRSIKYYVESGHSQIYFYQYSFVEDNQPFMQYTNVRGGHHCAQTFGALDGYWNDTIVEEKDVSDEMKKRKMFMRKIWLNFMTTGNPVPQMSDLPEWPTVKKDWSPYMSINKTLELKEYLDNNLRERVNFWEGIYDKHCKYLKSPM